MLDVLIHRLRLGAAGMAAAALAVGLSGAAQAQTLKTVGSLVQENPKQAAVIVRDWLSSAV